MSKLLKTKLTAHLPDLVVALDATPPTEREIESVRASVRAERDRLKQVEKHATVFLCILIAVFFVIVAFTGILVGAGAVAVVVICAAACVAVSAVGCGAVACAFLCALGIASVLASGQVGEVGAAVFAVVVACVSVSAGSAGWAAYYLQNQRDQLTTFEQSLETAVEEACIQILAWQKDPVIAAYCAKVVAERQFIAAEVETMRVWVDAAEQRKAVAEKQAKVDEACRALYRTA